MIRRLGDRRAIWANEHLENMTKYRRLLRLDSHALERDRERASCFAIRNVHAMFGGEEHR